MPIGADYMTHKELARLVGVSETTIKNYRRKFAPYLPLKAHGKPIKFMPQAADVCARIHRCFQQGLSVQETKERLDARYPDATLTRKRPQKSDPDGLRALAHSLDQLAQAQTRTAERLDALCTLLDARYAKAEAADAVLTSTLHAMRQSLAALAEAQASLPQPSAPGATPAPPTAPPPDQPPHRVRHVTVRNAYGDANEYLLETADHSAAAAPLGPIFPTSPQAPAPQEPLPRTAATPPPAPPLPLPDDIRDLPLAVRTDDGAFLGVAGKGFGHFSLAEFQALVTETFPAPAHFHFAWERLGNAIRFTAWQPQAPTPQQYALRIARTTTPRGNTVAVIEELLVDAVPTATAGLHTFIRQMRALRDAPPPASAP